MNTNRQNIQNIQNRVPTYLLVGTLTALGGLALGVTSSWIYNKFSKKKNDIKYSIIQHNQNITQTQDKIDGVYIQNEDDSELIFMTNDEFQTYFEYSVHSNNEIELEECLLEYALKLDPMNLRFFKESQKTLDYEKVAVEANINSIIYCRSTEETFCVKTQSDICSEEITYRAYEIHNFAFELYGNEIYKYINHPEGYSYEELMSMPPPEYKDMSVSEVFDQFQNKKNTDSSILNLKEMVKDQIPEILNIEFTNELTSSEEEDEDE